MANEVSQVSRWLARTKKQRQELGLDGQRWREAAKALLGLQQRD